MQLNDFTLQKQDLSIVSLGSHDLNSVPLVPGSNPSLTGTFRHTVWGISLQSESSTQVSLKRQLLIIVRKYS